MYICRLDLGLVSEGRLESFSELGFANKNCRQVFLTPTGKFFDADSLPGHFYILCIKLAFCSFFSFFLINLSFSNFNNMLVCFQICKYNP